MIFAFLETASSADQITAGLGLAGFAAVIHGAAYNAAEGALRPQRVLLKRGADAVALASVVAIVRMVVG
jgi:hypothetical protein